MRVFNFLILGFLLILSACTQKGSNIDDGFLGGVSLSLKQTSLTSTAATVGAGSQVTITLSVKDQSGNAFYVPNSNPVVVFSNAGGTSTGTFSPVVDSKNGTFTTTFTGNTAGSTTLISATIDGNVVDATASVQVTTGNLSLANSYITLSSATVLAGSSITAILHTKDTLNNPMTSGGLSVAFSHTGGTSSGSFSSVTDNNDGTYSVSFTGTTAGTATSISTTINAQPITSTLPTLTVHSSGASVILVSSGNSQAATVGTALSSNLIVVVRDASNNPVSSATVDWTVSGNAVLYSSSSTTDGSGLAANTLTIGTVTGNYTVTATIHGTSHSTTFTETATPGAINNFLLSSVPSTATAGTAFNFTVTARDQYNNTKTDYLGAVHFASSDVNSPTLPSNYTYLSTDLGVKQFSFTLKTSGNQTITVNQVAGGTPTSTTSNILVSAGTATQLVFITGPTNTQAGSAIGTMLVRALDAQGNTATSYIGTVTLAIGTNAGGGTLSGTLSGAATAGAISFSGVSINKSGVGYTLTASGTGGVTSTTSSTFNITAGSAATIAVSSGNNQSVVAGNALGASIVAIIQDSLGNPVSGVTVDWTTTSGALGSASSTTNSSGLASNTLTTSTTASSITATATLHSTSTSVSFSETATNGPATQIVYSTQPSGGVAEGINLPTQPVLVIKDVNGNTVTTGVDATANVTLSLSSGTGALTGTLTKAAVNGVATFTGIAADTQGSGKVITATKENTFFSGGTTSKTVASNSFTINPPAPGAFTISSAVASSSSVVLTWGASTNVSTYSVKYGTSSGSYTSTFSSNATSPTTVTGLTPGTTYYFMVTATNITGSTNATSEAVATPLSSFTISSATISQANTVRLTWGSSTGATSYSVKYGISSGSYGTTFSSSATSPTDVTGLTAGTTYYFMVVANNSSGSVNATAEVSATAIGSFTMSSVTPAVGSASVAWGSSTGSTSYDILYDTTSHAISGTYASSVTNQTSGNSVSSLAAGTTYYFRVRANNANGSVLSTNELSSAVYQNFVLNIPFTQGTDSSYILSDSTRVDLTGGVARLTPASQTDNSTNTGVSSGGFQNGTLTGVQWDNTNSYVRLNTTTNTAELDSSWTPQWSSLVGYWKMENNWNDSVGSNNGTGYNGVTFSASAKVGSYSGSFDGTNDYVEIPDATPLNITSAITVMGWVKLTNTTGWKRLLGKWSGSGYLLTVRDGKVQASLRNNHYQANSVIATNQWAHIAFTFNSVGGANNVKIYLNGVLDASFTLNNTIDTTTNPLRIGTSEVLSDWLPGNADDVALWSSDLSATQIQTIYARQSAKYSGQLTSRVLDAFSSQSWTTLSSITTLPFYKEMPGSSGSENSTNYSSQISSLMGGLVGLWHLNESSGTSFADSSSTGATGTSSGTISFTSGQLGNAVGFNGSSSYISAPWGLLTGNASRSFGLWFKTTSTTDSNWVSWGTNATNQLSQVGIYSGKIGYLGYGNDLSVTITTSNYADGRWHHIAVSFDGANRGLFLDGKLVASDSTTLNTGSSAINIGRSITSGNYYPGYLDEVAIWNRALSSAEVLELYRRGANRVKYQVRSCSSADCSDQDALTSSYKGWKGPDNTGLTYFSELYNTTNNVLGGIVATSSPLMTFANFGSLAVSNNRYFQYRAILESDDQNNLCTYNSTAANCSPELQSVAIGPNHYDTTIQSIISKASIGSAYQTLDTNGMTETLGSNSCSSGAKYSASSDGTNFYYWNGSAWTTSSAYATANDAATMRSNISSFPSSAAGTGTLQIKTYLKSDGTSPCEVDNLQFTGKKY